MLVLALLSQTLPSRKAKRMAKPRKKAPISTVIVICSRCKTRLYKYHKGGKGALVKCFKERIAQNYTTQPCQCPTCHQVFAREMLIRGTPAYKIIGGKAAIK